jgi:putative photosynthetic complex assembly protein
MQERAHQQSVPTGALWGAGALVLASLLLVGIARISGYRPARPLDSAVVASIDLRFEDRSDGAVLVYRGGDALVYIVKPGTNGFVRGVLRGLVRERRADHIGPTPPFRLTRWSDGRLSLDDPSTGRHVDLEVFGPANAGAFAEIFIASSDRKDPP